MFFCSNISYRNVKYKTSDQFVNKKHIVIHYLFVSQHLVMINFITNLPRNTEEDLINTLKWVIIYIFKYTACVRSI